MPLCIHLWLNSLWSPSGRCCCRNISSSRRGRGGPGGGSPAAGRRSNLRAAKGETGRHLSHTRCGWQPTGLQGGPKEDRDRDPGQRLGLGARRLTHNEALCLRELAEQFSEVLIALFIRRTQHLPRDLGHGNLSADSKPLFGTQKISIPLHFLSPWDLFVPNTHVTIRSPAIY